ncbi:MAG: hypothetical protein GX317_08805, partial [Staphylococcus equorum]|nr:hypothetical protein [Staphylococcus equorum]
MEKRHLLALAIWAIIYFTLNIYNVTGLLFVIPIVLFIVAIRNPILAISMWLITLPLGEYAFQNLFHLNRGLLLIGLLIRLIFSKRAVINKKLALFIVIFLFLSIVNLWINNDSVILGEYFFLYNSLGLFFFIIHFYVKSNNKSVDYLLMGLIIGAVTIAGAVLMQFDSSMLYGRLSFNQSIRGLANGLALPVLILYMNILNPNHLNIKNLNRVWSISFFMLFSLFLILTDSRGAIMPLFLSGFIYTVLSLNLRVIKNIFKWLIPTVIGVIYAFVYFDFSSRFRLRLIDFDSNHRFEIWGNSIGVFFNENLPNIIFGGGLGSFERYSMTGYGVGTYAHSVFLDGLVSFGIMGFTTLVFLIGYLFMISLKSKNTVALSVLIFTVLTFSTHGNLQHNLFWVYTALIYILCDSKIEK